MVAEKFSVEMSALIRSKFLAAKCNTKNHSVSLSGAISLFCHLLKISSGNPFLKFVALHNIFLWMKKKVVPPLTALLGHPVQNIFVALIKKSQQT